MLKPTLLAVSVVLDCKLMNLEMNGDHCAVVAVTPTAPDHVGGDAAAPAAPAIASRATRALRAPAALMAALRCGDLAVGPMR